MGKRHSGCGRFWRKIEGVGEGMANAVDNDREAVVSNGKSWEAKAAVAFGGGDDLSMATGETNLRALDRRAAFSMKNARPGAGGQLLTVKQARQKKKQEEKATVFKHRANYMGARAGTRT